MSAPQSKKYLGLELAGAKNQKTAIAALEYYPKGNKTFLVEIYDRFPSGDQALLQLLDELKPSTPRSGRMGVNVPLELPPCVSCTRKTCPTAQHCNVESVKWMRELTTQAEHELKNSKIRVHEFTPYTQRPVELWIRYEVLPKLPPSHRFEIDEALGGNKAPLTARMNFLKRHLKDIRLSEVWPKLSIAILAQQMGISKRTIARYRHLEDGVHAREEILETMSETYRIFFYERDVQKLAHSLAAFDAFVCAYTALLSDLNHCAEVPDGFPLASGWVDYPALDLGDLGDVDEPAAPTRRGSERR
jgi:hypothetical protein